ncbi:helix-turn-helix transcriptional regulator [Rhizobium sp. S-51]|uniref:Helix-turn-helix transcriptional regulator n=1 Tax=Rhizobium terricola TaxID=2728849 RepID=A0A7Y0AT52_9HYPH|nr:metalloregulator ArsR/SmtB family transcription factor [Rhizobium terricola]NML73029.1 helix-turn-helix transcriptional regulator [Rhizobium terricola]
MNLDETLKALAHPARIEMLVWLKDPAQHFDHQPQPLEMGVSAGQFERCGLSQSTVSAHLATLQRAGLISSTRVGQWVLYRRNEDVIGAFLNALNKVL